MLALVCQRLTNAEIAQRLVLSERTVESHVASLLRKLGATNRGGLIRAEKARPGSSPPFEREQLPFVGRSAELSRLERWWLGDPANTRLVVVFGDAGVGKTRLLNRFAGRVEASDVRVLYGRASEFGDSPYEPVSGALRQLVLTADDSFLDSLGDMEAGALWRVVPELRARRPGLAARADLWEQFDRSWLLDAVADCVAAVGSPLLVLDDLQWADRPALLLLARVLERQPTVRMIAGCRDPASTPSSGVGELLADLRRNDREVLRLPLAGLTTEDVAQMLAHRSGGQLSDSGRAFAGHLRDRTEGNAFFVRETLRQLEQIGAISLTEGRWAAGPLSALGISDGVREVVTARLSS